MSDSILFRSKGDMENISQPKGIAPAHQTRNNFSCARCCPLSGRIVGRRKGVQERGPPAAAGREERMKAELPFGEGGAGKENVGADPRGAPDPVQSGLPLIPHPAPALLCCGPHCSSPAPPHPLLLPPPHRAPPGSWYPDSAVPGPLHLPPLPQQPLK